MRRAVFLDRDGVIIAAVRDPATGRAESPYRSQDVSLLPGAADALRELRAAGWSLVVTSNQPAAQRGSATPEALRAVHERAVELLAAADVELDDWRYCLHDASAGCACRKPAPGLLVEAAGEHGIELAASWMVGDSDTDVEAGRRAGCRTILIEHPGTDDRRGGHGAPTHRVVELRYAAHRITGVSFLGRAG